jgi:hypothetical protein
MYRAHYPDIPVLRRMVDLNTLLTNGYIHVGRSAHDYGE